MKKITLSGLMFIALASQAQTFSDNFDSYTAGQYLGPQSSGNWTTWSNAPGTAEDVYVSNANSASAPNSLYFSTAVENGGPTDLVRNFGVLNTGQFTMNFNMLVENGKAGYFNFQKNATIGQVWAMDANFKDDGSLSIVNTTGLNFNTTYPQGTWFNFRIDIDFNLNKWEIFIDNVSAGYFSNTENQIASIDIFPVDQNAPYSAGYYIDDFTYTITPYVLPNLNAGVTYGNIVEGTIAGNDATPKFKVRNLGTSAITSFDIAVDYNGNQLIESFGSLNIASLAEQEFTLGSSFTQVAGANNMVFTVSNVNGLGADDDAGDDTYTFSLDPIVPAAGKVVVGEEGTGTWCGWCPRGTVWMDRYSNSYGPFWAGIAVHNGDPMTIADYDVPFSGLIGGYPSSLVDRGTDVDPSEMSADFYNRLQTAPSALMTNGATWNATTRELMVSVTAEFTMAASNDYKMLCVITEDSVTGTGSGWAQSNYYSSSSNNIDLIDDNGVNWKDLANPVPAAQMNYNHVARAITPSFDGDNTCFPASINAGDSVTNNYSFTLPAEWDVNNIHIIGILVNPNGRFDNAAKATLNEAVANGLLEACNVSIGEITSQLDDVLMVYPNPSVSSTTIAINLDKNAEVSLKLYDLTGKVIAGRDYGMISGSSKVELNTSDFEAGIYLVELTVDGKNISKRLIIE